MKKAAVFCVLVLLAAMLAAVPVAAQPACQLNGPGYSLTMAGVVYAYDAATNLEVQTIAPGQLLILNVLNSYAFANGTDSWTATAPFTWSNSLNGTTFTINGKVAPVTAMWLNDEYLFPFLAVVQVPYDLDVTKTAAIQMLITRPDGTPCVTGSHFVGTARFAPSVWATQVSGDYVTVYLNGCGVLAEKTTEGVPDYEAIPLPQDVSVTGQTSDGKPVTVPYAGNAPDYTGVCQINARVQPGSPTSGVTLTLRVAGQIATVASQ
jgi:uncharacterized protein (TIGR03437 family)